MASVKGSEKEKPPETARIWAWALAKQQILDDNTLTAEERKILTTCTIEGVVGEIERLDQNDLQRSKSRKVMQALQPVLSGLQKYGVAMDVLSQADPQGILTLTWGSIRLLLTVAKGWYQYFDELIDFMRKIASPLSRLEKYGELVPRSERLQVAIRTVFVRFLKFTNRTRRMFTDKANHSKTNIWKSPGAMAFKKNLWTNFGEEVNLEIKTIMELCDNAEREAALGVDQDTIERLERQEGKADGAYERQDVAHETIIGNQERQIGESKAESHLAHIERGRAERERTRQDIERHKSEQERVDQLDERTRAEIERQKAEQARVRAEKDADEARAERARAEEHRQQLAKEAEEAKKSKDAALMKEIVEWLNPVDAPDDFRRIRGERMKGTCDWILQEPLYRKWIDTSIKGGQAHRLWVHAIPGAGKTFLCTRMVEHLQEQGKSVAVFYCDTKDDRKRKLENVLRSWAWQLLLQSPGKLKNVEELYRSGRQSNIQTFMDAVKKFLDGNEERFLVLDGLDECEPPVRLQFYKMFSEFQNAKVLITSRPEDDIKKAMKMVGSDVETIKVEVADNANDIQHYLVEKVKEMPFEDKELESRINEELFDAAKGMFLYARLMITELSDRETPEEIEDALDDLPEGLDEIYGRILSRIDGFAREAKKKNARLLLKWICAAQEPLTLEQIREITAFNLDSDEDLLNSRRRLLSPEAFIYECCGPLVDIRTSDNKVQICHASVKDYLLNTIKTGDATYFVDINEAHNIVARSCLVHLSYTSIDVVDVDADHDRAMEKLEDHVKSIPMLRYTAIHWWRHTLECSQPMDEANLQRAFRKFATGSLHGVKWLQIYQYLRGDKVVWHPDANEYVGLIPYLVAINKAWKQVSDETTWLDEINYQDKYMRFYALLTCYNMHYYPAITIASLFDLADMVDREVSRGISVEVTNWSKESPIMLAARGNSTRSMKVLIKHGANPSHIGDQTESALHRAISWHGIAYEKVVRHIRYDTIPLLLEAGADVHLRNFAGDTLTHYVLRADYELPATIEVLKQLLNYGGDRDLSTKNSAGQTPLMIAAWLGHKGCARVLLDAGADPNGGKREDEKYYPTPLCAAAQKDDPTLGLMLIDAGADVNVADPWLYRTPLIEASIRGGRLVEALLNANADPNIPDKDGLYPIHHAAVENCHKIIPVLLRHGADLNVKDPKGKTALDLAVQQGRAESVRTLTEAGGIETMAGVTQETSIDTVAVEHPQSEKAILHTYFLLKTRTQGQINRNTIVSILNLAEYWIKTVAAREEWVIVTAQDEDQDDGFLPYIISSPITGANLYPVQKIVIRTLSHDQGFSSFPQHQKSYNNSWTGYRLRVRRTPDSAQNWIKHLEAQGHEEKKIREMTVREEHQFQVNRHGWREEKLHINTWARYGTEDELVKSLRKGDILEIVPWALYPGWQNHLLAASLSIYSSYVTVE